MRKLCGVLGAFVMIATMLTITGASAQDDEGGERVGDPDRVVEQPVSDPTVYPPPANGPAGPGSVSSAASGTSSTGVISVFFGPAPASVTLPVDAFGTINDVNARVRINHTWANDAVLTLKHPSGTSTDIKSSDLTDAVGLDDFGTGPACSGTFTTFDDEAATPIGAANPPFAGSFKPSNPLSVFDGKEAAGVWELTLGDDFPAVDDGTLLCFELVIDYTETFPTDFRNGSFEDGKHFAGWGVSDISPAFIPIGVRDPGFSPGFGLFPTAPTDGVQSASHGFDGMGPGNIDLYQDLKLPPGALLTFDWGAEWDYSFGTPTKDRSFDVIVAPAGGGTPLATIPIFETDFAGNGVSLASASVDDELEVNIETSRRGSISTSAVVGTGFFTTSIDLSNMPSANVRIIFRATIPESFTGPGHLEIDNVALNSFRSQVYVSNVIASGPAQYDFTFGPLIGGLLTGDWDGNGKTGFGRRDGKLYTLVNELGGPLAAVSYGLVDDETFVGDWDGNGTDTLAVRRGNTFFIANRIAPGPADVVIGFGKAGDEVFVGDWNGNGQDTFAVRRGNIFFVRNSTTTGIADIVFGYGKAGDEVLVGDWDNDGIDTFAVRRGKEIFIRNDFVSGPAQTVISFGKATDELLVGDFDGNGTDTFAVRRIEPI